MKLLIIVSLLALTGCSLKVNEQTFEPPSINLGPRLKDTKIKLSGSSDSNKLTPIDSVNERTSLYDLSSNLLSLYTLTGDEIYKEKALALTQSIYADSSNFISYKIEESPFFKAISKEGQELINPEIASIIEFIDTNHQEIDFILTHQVDTYFPWSDKGADILKVLGDLRYFIYWFGFQMKNGGVDPQIASTIMNTINNDYGEIIENINIQSEKLHYEKDFAKTIAIVKEIVKIAEIELPAETTQLLITAEEVSSVLKDHPNPDRVLLALVMIWEQMGTESRNATFGEVSPELNNFLTSSKEKTRNCLKQPKCLNLLSLAAKKLVILPKIKNLGVENIVSQVNESATDYIKAEVATQIADYIKTIPDIIQVKVSDELGTLKKTLNVVRHDPEGFVSKKVAKWANARLPNQKLILEVQRKTNSYAVIDSGLTASAIQMNTQYLKTLKAEELSPDDALLIGLSQVNKIAALLGYRETVQSAPSSWLMRTEDLNTTSAMKMLENKDSMSMPKSIFINNDFTISKAKTSHFFSSLDFAKLISSLSSWTDFSKDWLPSNFDSSMGSIKVFDLIDEFPKENLDYQIFRKDIMYSVSVFVVSELLQNLQRQNTNALLMNNLGEYHWLNEDKELSAPTALAAMVDISKGKRTTIVTTKNNTSMILALSNFFNSVDGIENTSSFLLKKEGPSGSTPIDDLNASTPELKRLSMALGNFISSKLQTENGVVLPSYDIQTKKQGSIRDAKFLDQTMSIQAFITLYKMYNKDFYKWMAIDTYYSLNTNFWNAKTNNYVSTYKGEKTINSLEATELLKTLHSLDEILPTKSIAQSKVIQVNFKEKLMNSINYASSFYVINDGDKTKESRRYIPRPTDRGDSLSTAVRNN